MPFLQNEVGLSKHQLADIVFCYSLAYAGGQFLKGELADRFTGRRIVAWGLTLAVAANLLMAPFARFEPLLLLGMLNGLAQSTGWPSLVKLMGEWFPSKRRGVVMAWWSTNYVLGGLLATLLASALVGAFPWTTAFWLPALLLGAITSVFLLLVPRDLADGSCRATPPKWNLLLARPVVHLIALNALVLKILRYTFLFWLPLYLSDRLRYRPDQAGFLSSAFELLGFGGALAAGYLSDRLTGGRRFPVIGVLLGGLALTCLIFPPLASSGWIGSLIAIMLVGFFTYGPDTLLQGAAAQDAGTATDAAATVGWINGIASLGQLLAPYLVASVAVSRGWDRLFEILVGTAAAGALLSLLGWNWRNANTR